MTSTATVTAAVEVRVDGRALADDRVRRLVSLRVATRLSLPAQCELAFVTGPGAAAEIDLCPLGSALTVRVYGDSGDLFDGEVTCVELRYEPDGAAYLRVRAYDRLHRLRKRQQLRVFNDVTAVDLARALTSDLGLDVEADDAGPSFERIVQDRQHDFALLTAITARTGRYPALDGDTLRLLTLEGYGDPVDLELGSSLLEARIEANLDRAGSRVTALGWHPQRAELLEGEATTARSGRRITFEPDPSSVGADGASTVVDQSSRSVDELVGVAQADLDARVGRAVTISGVADGNARLRVGARIAVRGVAGPIAGTYVLTEVVHTVDATGYQSTFGTEPPRVETPTAGASVTLGKVTALDDPDALGRVRVSLPAHGDLDAGWLGVLCPGAGAGRGIVALPDVDDTVLVLLPHGVPAEGVVLGSLFGAITPPDTGVDGGAVKRWTLRTAQGQSIVVNDAEHSLRLENKVGSFVELGPELLKLHAQTDVMIEAPGKAVTVRGKTVDFIYAASQE
jgi:phage protein D/phage baseplate assembly protein gpV